MNYADPFGVQETTPLSRALRRIELTADQQLNWPSGYLGPDYIASINAVTPSVDGLSLILPDALGANEGTGFLMVNRGQFQFSVKDFSGTVLTTLLTGQSKYIYCEQNSDSSGSWHTMTFGEGVSVSDAVELAGSGLTVDGGKLASSMTISITSSDVNITAQHRGKMMVNNGGSIKLNLPQYTDVGNNFFFSVHNGGSGTVTIQPATTNTVDDYASLSLAPNESVFVCCSGTAKWYTVGYGRSTQFQFTKLVKDISAGGTIQLTSAEASNKLLQFTGTPATNATVIVPSVVGIYYVQNTFNGPNTLTLKTQNGAGLSLNSSDRAIVYCDGVNVVSAQSVAVGVNLSVVDGSLSTPSISFSSDTNTGLYKADFDTIGIVSNGIEAARFHNVQSYIAGLLGIGTIQPLAKVHILSQYDETVRLQSDKAYISFYKTDGSARNGYVQGYGKELRYEADAADGTHAMYIHSQRILEVNPGGIKVFGNVIDGNNNQFATLNANTFTGIQVMPIQRGKFVTPTASAGVLTVDASKSNTFSYTVTGPVRIDFTGKPPAGQDQTIYLKLINGGTNVTYGSMCQFSNSGLRPTLSSSGKDVLAVWYDTESDCFVVGQAFKDYRG